MADSVIDHLFDEAISSDLPMPGAELDFFLDHLPVDDTSTFDVVGKKLVLDETIVQIGCSIFFHA